MLKLLVLDPVPDNPRPHFVAEADFVSGVRRQRHLIGRALVRRREIEHYGGARH